MIKPLPIQQGFFVSEKIAFICLSHLFLNLSNKKLTLLKQNTIRRTLKLYQNEKMAVQSFHANCR